MLQTLQTIKLPSKYRYFCTKQHGDTVKVWGAYCTYFCYADWPNRFEIIDDTFLFNGIIGKPFKYTVSVNPYMVNTYYNSYKRKGFIHRNDFEEILEQYPDIQKGLEQKMFWHTLRK